MIYLSAQPDDMYFTWQIELQIRNFQSLGIKKDQIHVLIAYNSAIGLNPLLNTFLTDNEHLAMIYCYPDMRLRKKYPSSIRPNIIKQHYERFPELSNKVVFYHDSDILLSRIPNIANLYNNNICYVSDTRDYLDSGYIKNSGSEKLLRDMASIVGLEVGEIENNDNNTGGAQYILKGLSKDFWGKVEEDCEDLYVVMLSFNIKKWEKGFPKSKVFRSKNPGIQAWCADMWALLWNLWHIGIPVEIHDEMIFSWPDDPVSSWKRNSILHYSGSQIDDNIVFKKTTYTNYAPWYDHNLLEPPIDNCCKPIIDAIISRKLELENDRIDLSDVCFILELKDSEDDQLRFLTAIQNYLSKYFKCQINIYIDELHRDFSLISEDILSSHNWMNKLSHLDVPIFFYLPATSVIDKGQILSLVKLIRCSSEQTYALTPNNIYLIDQIFSEAFSKTLDINVLAMNLGKFHRKKDSDDQIILIKKTALAEMYPAAANTESIRDHFRDNSMQTNGKLAELEIFTLKS